MHEHDVRFVTERPPRGHEPEDHGHERVSGDTGDERVEVGPDDLVLVDLPEIEPGIGVRGEERPGRHDGLVGVSDNDEVTDIRPAPGD